MVFKNVRIKDLVMIYIFLIVNKSHEKNKQTKNNEVVPPTIIISIDLHFCAKTIKTHQRTLPFHWVTCFLFMVNMGTVIYKVNPTYMVHSAARNTH